MAISPYQRLTDWFATPQGARLAREETVLLAEAVRRFHGDTLLWLGCHEEVARTVRGCMVRNRFYGSETSVGGMDDLAPMRCSPAALPLPNNSVDAMVLHHALEGSRDARSGLREAARVLAPGGRLVICAFNPLSVWGLRRAYAGVARDAFSGVQFLTTYRLLDWLAVLGFECQGSVRYLAYNLPFGAPRRDADTPGRAESRLRRLQPPVGGVQLLSVIKQALAVRPDWRGARMNGTRLLPAAYPKSAVNRAPVLQFSDWKDLERGG